MLKLQYSGVSTKVRALFGKMLQPEDYQNILEKEGVHDIYEYLLNNTFYKEYLSQLDNSGEIHRRQLERTLKKNFVNDFYDIRLYLHGPAKDFFDHLFTEFEIEEVKMILRTILIEHDREYLEQNIVYLDERDRFAIDKLAEINDYQSLLNVFRDTWFFNVLQRFESRYESDKNLFPIETSLDLKYFSLLRDYSEKLSNKDNKIIWQLLGIQVDMLNINWVYRIKKYYELGQEEIMNYLIPYTYKISRSTLREMANANNCEEIFNIISNTKYKDVFSSLEEENDILFEKYCRSYILEQAIKVKTNSFLDLGLIISYLIMKEYEIQDIITIVEGVRYSLDRNKIPQFLIRNNIG